MTHLLGRGLSGSLLFALLGSVSAGCLNTEGSSDGAGANSAGGSASTYVAPTCDQGCQDYLVAWALDDTIWFLWNQKIAGHPVGSKDIMGACALGGSVHITGTDDVAGGTTTTAIQFAFDACETSNTLYDLTFTGTVSMDGSFDGDTNSGAEVFSAPGLDVSGSLNWLDDPAIDQGCDVTFTQRGLGDDSTLSGRVCGRNFDEGSLDQGSSAGSGTGGGSGQGGSSSTAGSSGSNCACFCDDGSDCTGAKTSNPCGVDADGIPNACACPVDCK